MRHHSVPWCVAARRGRCPLAPQFGRSRRASGPRLSGRGDRRPRPRLGRPFPRLRRGSWGIAGSGRGREAGRLSRGSWTTTGALGAIPGLGQSDRAGQRSPAGATRAGSQEATRWPAGSMARPQPATIAPSLRCVCRQGCGGGRFPTLLRNVKFRKAALQRMPQCCHAGLAPRIETGAGSAREPVPRARGESVGDRELGPGSRAIALARMTGQPAATACRRRG